MLIQGLMRVPLIEVMWRPLLYVCQLLNCTYIFSLRYHIFQRSIFVMVHEKCFYYL